MLLFKAASGEDGAGDGGGMLLLDAGVKVCSLKTCSFAPLKQKSVLQVIVMAYFLQSFY